jgi:drug/metabolite transporter (DMT)-like permease
VAFAGHIIALGHYSSRMSFEILSISQVGTAAALALSVFWWAETPRIYWRWEVWFAIAITGLLATALAFTIQAWAQQYTTATRTALIFTLEPVFAWLTSFLLTGELLSQRATLGACLILAGILLVELKPSTQRAHPSR